MRLALATALGLILLTGTFGCAVPPPSTQTLPAARPLPPIPVEGEVWRDGARLWFGVIGEGPPVILLHGGLSSHQAWSRQVPALIGAGYQVILVDSRGHGRSTLGQTPLTYPALAHDVAAVIDHLDLQRPAIVGWSDGAITALVLGMDRGDRLGPIYAFGANMDQAGVRAGASNAPILLQAGPRLVAEYLQLAPEPDFPRLAQAVRSMQAALDYGPTDLARIRAPRIRIEAAARDEFITPEHFVHLARSIPGTELQILPDSGHFAPWQNPDAFNRSIIAFLKGTKASNRTAVATAPAAAPSFAATVNQGSFSSLEIFARCSGSSTHRLRREEARWVCGP